MNGFGFIEYEDAMDARDVVPGKPLFPFAGLCQQVWPMISVCLLMRSVSSLPYVPTGLRSGFCFFFCCLTTFPVPDGSDFKGERLTVQFARGPRHKDTFHGSDRSVPRPRRTIYRMQVSGLPSETSWQVSSPCLFLPGLLGYFPFGPFRCYIVPFPFSFPFLFWL